MPIPAGFKINGTIRENAAGTPVPPRVHKIITILDGLDENELVTTIELSALAGVGDASGRWPQHAGLSQYREKVDNKLFWGSRVSIAHLREQLAGMEKNQ